MPAYLLRRLIQSALILLGVAFITFFSCDRCHSQPQKAGTKP